MVGFSQIVLHIHQSKKYGLQSRNGQKRAASAVCSLGSWRTTGPILSSGCGTDTGGTTARNGRVRRSSEQPTDTLAGTTLAGWRSAGSTSQASESCITSVARWASHSRSGWKNAAAADKVFGPKRASQSLEVAFSAALVSNPGDSCSLKVPGADRTHRHRCSRQPWRLGASRQGEKTPNIHGKLESTCHVGESRRAEVSMT